MNLVENTSQNECMEWYALHNYHKDDVQDNLTNWLFWQQLQSQCSSE